MSDIDREVVTETVRTLRAAGCVFAEEEAELLHAAARSPAELAELVARRVAGTPLEQIVGWAEFRGLRIAVEPGVFVPRTRSGLLVERTVALRPALVVDLCCGSGAIGAAIAAELPGVEVHAADVEPAAVRCARRNLPPERVHLGDVDAALPAELRGRVDVLVANAPYVPTADIPLMPPEARDHELRSALDGGSDGLDLHRRIAAAAPGWLRPGGHLLIETSRRQAAGTAAAMTGFRTEVIRSEELDGTVVDGVHSLSGGGSPPPRSST